MTQLSKTEQFMKEMRNYGLAILALSDARWTAADKQNEDMRYTTLHSFPEKKKAVGVAIMLST